MHIRNKDSRRFFRQYLGGKLIGLTAVIAVVYGLAWYFNTKAGAAVPGATALKGDDIVNPLNTVWVLVTAFLVFFMQAGFMMLEGGFARTREVSNIMIECIIDTALCGILFYAFGFAFMFGSGNGWIGYHYFFLQGVPHTYGTTGIAFMAFFLACVIIVEVMYNVSQRNDGLSSPGSQLYYFWTFGPTTGIPPLGWVFSSEPPKR